MIPRRELVLLIHLNSGFYEHETMLCNQILLTLIKIQIPQQEDCTHWLEWRFHKNVLYRYQDSNTRLSYLLVLALAYLPYRDSHFSDNHFAPIGNKYSGGPSSGHNNHNCSQRQLYPQSAHPLEFLLTDQSHQDHRGF